MRSLMFLGALVAACAASAGTVYVDAGNCPGGDGTSWATARCDIQSAIDAAAPGDQVFVRAGVYQTPITMRSQVSLFGGFVGTETSSEERDILANETIIRAPVGNLSIGITMIDLQGASIDGLRVEGNLSAGTKLGLVGIRLDKSCVVRNCTFLKHYSYRTEGSFGGGMFLEDSPITLENCTFTLNGASSGGGLYAGGCDGLTITGSRFVGNDAGSNGGAIYAVGSSVTIRDSEFLSNSGPFGGGIVFEDCEEELVVDCRFVNNDNTRFGAALSSVRRFATGITNLRVERCVFTHSSCYAGDGALYVEGHDSQILDSIFAENTSGVTLTLGRHNLSHCTFYANSIWGIVTELGAATVNNSIFSETAGSALASSGADVYPGNCVFDRNTQDFSYQGDFGYVGAEAINANIVGAVANISGSPAFRDAGNLDFHLLAASAALNAASAIYATYTDFDQQPRPGDDGQIESGAFEAGDLAAPEVTAITRADGSPTNASIVQFDVTFSEAVSGVDTTDFQLDVTGAKAVADAEILGVRGAGTGYTVTVSTGTGDGTIRLQVRDDNSIMDGAGNPLGGPEAGDGDFTLGEVYVVDRTAPVITLLGDAEITLGAGTDYAEAGAAALDTLDGDLSGAIIMDGAPNTDVPGTYAVTYAVSDTAGNVGTATRTVVVLPEPDFFVAPAWQFIGSTAATVNFDVINRTATPATWSATVVTGAEWCTITAGASGNGALGTITVQCAANTTATERTATIQVTDGAKADLPITVEIVQAAAITGEGEPDKFFACSGEGRGGAGLGAGDWMVVLLLGAGLAARRAAGTSTR